MNLSRINESFRKKYASTLNESIDRTAAEDLRAALDDTAFRLSMKQIVNLKSYEIAFQDTIEEMFPDKAWWEVTDCNIFMDLFEHRDIDHTINEIVEKFKLEEDSQDEDFGELEG